MATVDEQIERNTVFCTQCGTEVQQGSSKCSGCGVAQSPSSKWTRISLLMCGASALVIGFGLESSGFVGALSGGVIFLSWLLLPIATYQDMRHVRATGAWEPTGGLWMAGFLVPLANIGTALYYLKLKYDSVGTV